MTNHTIHIKNLDVTYKNILPFKDSFTALKNINLTLEEGRIYGLLGRNGAGKTTLLSVLASFIHPTKGTLTIDGHNILDNSAYMKDVLFIYQRSFVLEKNTNSPKVKHYIKEETQFRPNFDADYAQHLLKLFNIPQNKRMSKLSKGMQSMVGIVIGLASRCPITIFGEAYLGMDAPSRDLFYKEILKAQEQFPRTMIFSTHLISEMEYLFDDIIIIDKGQVIQADTYEQTVTSGVVITGVSSAVDIFTAEKKTIGIQRLGNVKKALLYHTLTDKDLQQCDVLGLEVTYTSLQDLFIRLTDATREEYDDEM